MIPRIVPVTVLLLASPSLLSAQDCKLKFAVAYTDGKALQVGLTPEQKKFWDREGAKHFKGMCLDAREPHYIILWSEGLSGAELFKAAVDQFNRNRATGQATSPANAGGSEKTSTTDSRWMDGTAYIRPTQAVRAKADYYVLDTSNTPYSIIRQGQGYQDVPFGPTNRPGQSIKTSDMASTIADPAAALENALKWLRKEKKL